MSVSVSVSLPLSLSLSLSVLWTSPLEEHSQPWGSAPPPNPPPTWCGKPAWDGGRRRRRVSNAQRPALRVPVLSQLWPGPAVLPPNEIRGVDLPRSSSSRGCSPAPGPTGMGGMSRREPLPCQGCAQLEACAQRHRGSSEPTVSFPPPPLSSQERERGGGEREREREKERKKERKKKKRGAALLKSGKERVHQVVCMCA